MYCRRLFSVFLKTVNTRLQSTINQTIRAMLLFVLDCQQLAGGKIARKPPETNSKYQAQYSQVKLIDGSPSRNSLVWWYCLLVERKRGHRIIFCTKLHPNCTSPMPPLKLPTLQSQSRRSPAKNQRSTLTFPNLTYSPTRPPCPNFQNATAASSLPATHTSSVPSIPRAQLPTLA